MSSHLMRKLTGNLSKLVQIRNPNSNLYFCIYEFYGHPASHYLDKAKTMFEEMDLQWDLGVLRKYNKSIN